MERREAERLDQLRLAEESARQEADAARLRSDEAAARAATEAQIRAQLESEAVRRSQRVQTRIGEMGLCPMQFRWIDVGGGCYRCAGGSHTVHIDDLGLQ